MKILIVGALDPHDNHDEKMLCETVSSWYTNHGHTTDICYLPFKMDYYGVHEQILAYRMLTTFPEAEMLVSVGYPAFALKHPNKHVLLMSFLPEFHCNYNTEYGFMEQWYKAEKDLRFRQNLLNVEKRCLSESKTIHCSSSVLADEITSLGCESSVFQFCAQLPNREGSEVEQDEIITQTCLMPMDRIDMLLEAVKDNNVKLRLFIPSAEECYLEAVRLRAKRYSISDRVRITKTEIGLDDLKQCKGTICLRRGAGSMPSWVQHAVLNEVPSIVASDCGALYEAHSVHETIKTEPKIEAVAKCLKAIQMDKRERVFIEQPFPLETAKILESWVK